MNTSNSNTQSNSSLDQQLDFLGLNEKPIVDPILTINHNTKADLGRTIWNEEVVSMNGQCPIRATTIKRLMTEANLTKAGASTYYQNMKKKAGFVNKK